MQFLRRRMQPATVGATSTLLRRLLGPGPPEGERAGPDRHPPRTTDSPMSNGAGVALNAGFTSPPAEAPASGPPIGAASDGRKAPQAPAADESVGRVDPTLRLDSFRVHPGFVEALLSGPSLPRQMWCRLGRQSFVLQRRPQSETPSAGPETQVRYAAVPETPVRASRFLHLPEAGHERTGETFELRRGDSKGRRPGNLPDTIQLLDGPRLLHSDVVLAHGALTGWALDIGGHEVPVRMRLAERLSEEAGTEEHTLSTGVADRPSEDGQSLTGSPACGFSLPLPGRIVDGRSHDLVVYAFDGEDERAIWRDRVTVTPEAFRQMFQHCTSTEEVRDMLHSARENGNLPLVASFFDAPARFCQVPLSRSDALAVLAPAVTTATVLAGADPDGPMEAARARLARHLSFALDLTRLDPSEVGKLVDALEGAIRDAASDTRLKRFPHAPLAEALTDLAMLATEATNWPKPVVIRLATLCTSAGRVLLGHSLCERVLSKAPDDPDALMAAARASLGLGDLDAAEKRIRALLKVRPRDRPALRLMARVYAARGEPLKAAAAAGGGQGLMQWHADAPSYEVNKPLAPLDWRGISQNVAARSGRVGFRDHLRHADQIFGPPDPVEEGFSLVFLDRAHRDNAQLFGDLSPIGCNQVLNAHGAMMDELEVIGGWVLVFQHARSVYLRPEFVSAMFSQLREGEPVLHLQVAKTDGLGLPVEFTTAGLLIRLDAMRLFSSATVEEFAKNAADKLAVKPLLL